MKKSKKYKKRLDNVYGFCYHICVELDSAPFLFFLIFSSPFFVCLLVWVIPHGPSVGSIRGEMSVGVKIANKICDVAEKVDD